MKRVLQISLFHHDILTKINAHSKIIQNYTKSDVIDQFEELETFKCFLKKNLFLSLREGAPQTAALEPHKKKTMVREWILAGPQTPSIKGNILIGKTQLEATNTEEIDKIFARCSIDKRYRLR